MSTLFLLFGLLILDNAASFSTTRHRPKQTTQHRRKPHVSIRLDQCQLSLLLPISSYTALRTGGACLQQTEQIGRSLATRLSARNDDNDDLSFLDSDDPFRVLQISSSSPDAVNAKEIRKAYRRMAVRFHPDVTTNKDSSAAEKKLANDRFAKINWAYQTLSGKNGASSAAGTASGASSSSSTAGGGWTPPHRRTQSYASSSSRSSSGGASTDWRDYIPNYRKEQEEMYNTNGDSFESIFSDLFKAAGQGVAGGGGILKDFVEFLENEAGTAASSFGVGTSGSSGFGGTRSGSSLDTELQLLLKTGTVEEVAEEMDDTQLVEQQLETKLNNLRNDVVSLKADLSLAADFKDRIQYQEELASVEARIPVVENYLKQARKRLLALQTRYKELIVSGSNDPKAGGGGGEGSVWDEIRNEARSSSSSSSSTYDSRKRASTSTASSAGSQRGKSDSDDDDDAWKSDSFGSFGRGRGSSGRGRSSRSRRNRSQSYSSGASRSSSSYSSSPSSSSSSYSSPASRQPQSAPRPPPSSAPQTHVPPHRRAGPSYEEDRRRLRELKVDEEFDKLKKELGL